MPVTSRRATTITPPPSPPTGRVEDMVCRARPEPGVGAYAKVDVLARAVGSDGATGERGHLNL